MPRGKARVTKPNVRDRIMDAADRLFYREGVRGVGIDRVLAEADAAKASLYAHFGCKDELIAVYLERRAAEARARIEAFVVDTPPAQRALRFFDWVVEWTESGGFCGCPMQHAVSEINDTKHPARVVAAAQREWLYARFLEWCRAAKVSDKEATAGALMVLFDGAVAASEQDGPQRARDARWTAQLLLSR